ncbi:MAG: glycosyltransferase family 39 protein [Candidatus Eisenbacteria sp.]|nr:glycosyltransferase family 39 protein [Candidatus Eisenbacteria bacterium]
MLTGRRRASTAWIWLILIALAAVLLRFLRLGGEGLWCDEAYTALRTAQPLGTMIDELVHHDEAPPLFYLLSRLIVGLFGDGEFALRLLPAAASCAAVVVMLIRARRRREPELFWAAAFFAIASYGVFYARQARSYGLLQLLALVFIFYARDFLAGARRTSRTRGVGLALSAGLLCFTHHLGVILVLASLPLWILHPRRRPRLLHWIGWHAAPLLLLGLYWLFSATQWEMHASYNQWMATHWQDHPLALAPLFSIGVLSPAGRFPIAAAVPLPELGAGGELATLASLALVLTALGAGLVGAVRATRIPGTGHVADPQRESESLRWWLTDALSFFLPLIALLSASLLVSPAYVLGRSDAIVFPSFALLIGRGLARLPRWGTMPAVLLWTVVSIAALAPAYGWRDGPLAKGTDRRVATALVSHGLQSGDWLVHGVLTAPAVEYYLDRLGAEHQSAWFPAFTGINPAAAIPTPIDSLRAYEREAYRLRELIDAALPEAGSVWILGQLTSAGAASWPLRGGQIAVTPSGEPRLITAGELGFPASLLLYALAGMTEQPAVIRYRQDWIGGERVAVRVPRETWIPRESLSPVQLGAAVPENRGPAPHVRRINAQPTGPPALCGGWR